MAEKIYGVKLKLYSKGDGQETPEFNILYPKNRVQDILDFPQDILTRSNLFSEEGELLTDKIRTLNPTNDLRLISEMGIDLEGKSVDLVSRYLDDGGYNPHTNKLELKDGIRLWTAYGSAGSSNDADVLLSMDTTNGIDLKFQSCKLRVNEDGFRLGDNWNYIDGMGYSLKLIGFNSLTAGTGDDNKLNISGDLAQLIANDVKLMRSTNNKDLIRISGTGADVHGYNVLLKTTNSAKALNEIKLNGDISLKRDNNNQFVLATHATFKMADSNNVIINRNSSEEFKFSKEGFTATKPIRLKNYNQIELLDDLGSRVSSLQNRDGELYYIGSNLQLNIDDQLMIYLDPDNTCNGVIETCENLYLKPGDDAAVILKKGRSLIFAENAEDVSDDYYGSINIGVPTHRGEINPDNFYSRGLSISQGMGEASGIQFNDDRIVMWSAADGNAIEYYDEDDNNELVFRIDDEGNYFNREGRRAAYIDEVGSGGGNSNPTNVTYQELVGLINSSNLIPNAKYIITDYRTVYIQPETNFQMSGDLEPIIVTAFNKNTLFMEAKSTIHKDDTLHYDITNKWWTPSSGKGTITRRIDANNNSMPYDHESIKFRRYAIDETKILQHNPASSYKRFDFVIYGTGVNRTIYICKNNIAAKAFSSNEWVKAVQVNYNNKFYVSTDNNFYLRYGRGSKYSITNMNDYIDCYTFTTTNLQKNHRTTSVKNNFFGYNSDLINSVFFSSTYDNKIDGYTSRNTIIGMFYKNEITGYFEENLIYSFGSNKSSYMYYNTIYNAYSNNFTGLEETFLSYADNNNMYGYYLFAASISGSTGRYDESTIIQSYYRNKGNMEYVTIQGTMYNCTFNTIYESLINSTLRNVIIIGALEYITINTNFNRSYSGAIIFPVDEGVAYYEYVDEYGNKQGGLI